MGSPPYPPMCMFVVLTTCWITTSVVASGPQHPKLVINAGVPLMTAVNVAGQLQWRDDGARAIQAEIDYASESAS
jgi:hypothetical protein